MTGVHRGDSTAMTAFKVALRAVLVSMAAAQAINIPNTYLGDDRSPTFGLDTRPFFFPGGTFDSSQEQLNATEHCLNAAFTRNNEPPFRLEEDCPFSRTPYPYQAMEQLNYNCTGIGGNPPPVTYKHRIVILVDRSGSIDNDQLRSVVEQTQRVSRLILQPWFYIDGRTVCEEDRALYEAKDENYVNSKVRLETEHCMHSFDDGSGDGGSGDGTYQEYPNPGSIFLSTEEEFMQSEWYQQVESDRITGEMTAINRGPADPNDPSRPANMKGTATAKALQKLADKLNIDNEVDDPEQIKVLLMFTDGVTSETSAFINNPEYSENTTTNMIENNGQTTQFGRQAQANDEVIRQAQRFKDQGYVVVIIGMFGEFYAAEQLRNIGQMLHLKTLSTTEIDSGTITPLVPGEGKFDDLGNLTVGPLITRTFFIIENVDQYETALLSAMQTLKIGDLLENSQCSCSTASPTITPTSLPTSLPTPSPTGRPSTTVPTPSPTGQPATTAPTPSPTGQPATMIPTPFPTTLNPTREPTDYPTRSPYQHPPTTLCPSPPPTHYECVHNCNMKCGDQYTKSLDVCDPTPPDYTNIGIQVLLDQSGSIDDSDFTEAVDTTRATALGLLGLASVEDFEIEIGVRMFDQSSVEWIAPTNNPNDIQNAPLPFRPNSGGTATGRAINETFDAITNDFADADLKLLIIVTDGVTQENQGDVSEVGNVVELAAEKFKSSGWEIYVVFVDGIDANTRSHFEHLRRLTNPQDSGYWNSTANQWVQSTPPATSAASEAQTLFVQTGAFEGLTQEIALNIFNSAQAPNDCGGGSGSGLDYHFHTYIIDLVGNPAFRYWELSIDTCGSDFDTLVSLMRWGESGSLEVVASDSGSASCPDGSRASHINIPHLPPGRYTIMVEANNPVVEGNSSQYTISTNCTHILCRYPHQCYIDSHIHGDDGPRGDKGLKGHPGSPGRIGEDGLPGVKGAKGADAIPLDQPNGNKGDNGRDGDDGYKGMKGRDGQPGDPGAKGPKGRNGILFEAEKGEHGEPGEPGDIAPKGDPGRGFKGIKGHKGPAHRENGLVGDRGDSGLKGRESFKGNKGMPGTDGTPGDDGFKGMKGRSGEDGLPGSRGSDGVDAPEFGLKGDKGFKGFRGPQGYPGRPGRDGHPGIPGRPGIPGQPGRPGFDGIPGRPGASGEMGDSGMAFKGSKGHKGHKGMVGETGPTGPLGYKGFKGQTSDECIDIYHRERFNRKLDQFSGCVQTAANHNSEVCMVGLSARANASNLLQRITSCTSFQFEHSEVVNIINRVVLAIFTYRQSIYEQIISMRYQIDYWTSHIDRAIDICGNTGRKGHIGVDGPKGDPGNPGSPGRPGDGGDSGLKGLKGLKGHAARHQRKGSKGSPGDDSIDGPKGLKGAGSRDGENGLQGPGGDPGTVTGGVKGFKGVDGIKGQRGYKGEKGPREETGLRGDTGGPGDPGHKGNKGYMGKKGSAQPKGQAGTPGGDGEDGLDGTNGTRGAPGIPGAPGTPGHPGTDGHNYKGHRGFPGHTGLHGLIGIPGSPGLHGDAGVDGNNGLRGVDGSPGVDGFDGQDGEKGLKGLKGHKGPLGETGIVGSVGPKGSHGPVGTKGVVGEDGVCIKSREYEAWRHELAMNVFREVRPEADLHVFTQLLLTHLTHLAQMCETHTESIITSATLDLLRIEAAVQNQMEVVTRQVTHIYEDVAMVFRRQVSRICLTCRTNDGVIEILRCD